MKERALYEVGFSASYEEHPSSVSEQVIIERVQNLSSDHNVDGILVQLPLPGHIDPYRVAATIHPQKDIDCLHPSNLGNVLLGRYRKTLAYQPISVG